MAKRQTAYDNCSYDGDEACAVEAFLDVLGGRWKGMILFHLLGGTKRFSELRKALPHVTQRMLTAQLRELERDHVLTRKVYPQVPPRVDYSLTEMGAALAPAVSMMVQWGDQYMRAYGEPPSESAPPAPPPPPPPPPPPKAPSNRPGRVSTPRP